MPPTTLSVTVTATVTPPLDAGAAQGAGVELAARVGGELISTGSDDRGWHSWQFALDHESDARLGLRVDEIEKRLVTALPAEHDVQVNSLEALTMAEVERRLAQHGVPPHPTTATTGLHRRRAIEEMVSRGMPEVVSTAQFAELLGVDDSRVRQLRAERERAMTAGEAHPFPSELLPGLWTKDAALHYIEHGRRGPGRPRKSSAE